MISLLQLVNHEIHIGGKIEICDVQIDYIQSLCICCSMFAYTLSCNIAGSIIQINLSYAFIIEVGDRFGKLNFSPFPNLVLLDLSHHQLGGKISHQIGKLSALKHLDLSNCGLSGELPPSLGNLTQLECLDISYNDKINGSVPPQLGNLVNLVSLKLDLTGKIPSELGFLSNWVYLDLYSNKLFDPIPFTLYHMTNLEHLCIDNYLEGSISKNIENFKKISFLSITNNRFTDHIPLALSLVHSLLALVIYPTWENLELDSNLLNGPIPSCLCRLSKFHTLRLDSNLLEGPIHEEICDLANSISLSLNLNKLNGSIPSCIFGFELGVGFLWGWSILVVCNFFCCLIFNQAKKKSPIPEEICNLVNLTSFNLFQNKLSGSILSCIGKLSKVDSLPLSSNLLKCPIPQEICILANLTSLDLSQNKLSGTIPSCIGSLSKMQHLSLGSNILKGPIPKEIGKLCDLSYLNLGFNQFSGPVPMSATSLYIISPDPFEGNSSLSPYMCPPLTNKANNGQEKLCRCTTNEEWGFIAYEDIVATTEDFNIRFCIGVGGYGSVYSEKLPCGKVVALKKFHHLEAVNPTLTRVSGMRSNF
ncbi:hypothetical protein CXB51_024494 [Gossypium anomalum]|uniref:Protein kinase domain-containing protein n=1 Tax=Gossypium anomalum TaxID=47600 RepID=A0A8J5YD22_9ROSI|nr:hypothetical protein CXB51_024494 [Gossypium anomalum]